MEGKGWTITYYPWDDDRGLPRVANRFKASEEKEKDEFLESIHKSDSG